MLRSAAGGGLDAGAWGALAFQGISFIVIPGLMLVMAFYVFKTFKNAKGTRDSLVSRVRERGFGYVEEDPARAQYFTGEPFGNGGQRRARNVVWGAIDGKPFETFAYTHDTGYTIASADYYERMRNEYGMELNSPDGSENVFQVTWVPLPGALPTTRFVSHGAGWDTSSQSEARVLKSESAEFNRRWTVECDDPRVGHALLTPRMIERFLESDLEEMIVSFEGAAVWTASRGSSDLYEVDYLVRRAYSIADLIPPFVFQDRSGEITSAAVGVTASARPSAHVPLGWEPTMIAATGLAPATAIDPFLAGRGFGYLAQSQERASYFHTPPLWYGGFGSVEDVVWGTLGGVTFERYTRDVTAVGGDGGGVPTGLLAHPEGTPQSFRVTWLPLRTSLPAMRITSGNALRNGELWLGAQDVMVESSDFDERWTVKCVDERVAHALFTPPMIERFLRPDIQGHSFVIEGSAIVHYEIGPTDYSDIDQKVAMLDSVARLIPNILLDQGSGG